MTAITNNIAHSYMIAYIDAPMMMMVLMMMLLMMILVVLM